MQRLLGPSTAQDVIQLTTGQTLNHQGIRDTRLLVMDASTDQNVNRTTGNGTPGTLSNFTALHWWCEEAKVLDGESMHDCIVGIKRAVVDVVESDRDAAFLARKEKRRQDEEAKKKSQEQNNAGSQAQSSGEGGDVAAAGTSLLASRPTLSNNLREIGLATDDEVSSVLSPNADGSTTLVSAPSERHDPQQRREQLLPGWRETARSPLHNFQLSDEQIQDDLLQIGIPPHSDGTSMQVPQQASTTVETYEAHPPFLHVGEEGEPVRPVFTYNPTCPLQNPPLDPDGYRSSSPEMRPMTPPGEVTEPSFMGGGDGDTSISAGTTPLFETNVEPVAGPSGLQSHSFREILGDIEIPDGVDPSFLAALPEDMRQEVISEHLRIQRLREQVTQPVVPEAPTASALDVSPEFLAALPLNIQEEVLAQQRLEQQRRVATTANPDDPVDAEAFFRTLQPNLRQVILADMEESQMAAIPPEFAEEAQNLRRNWVTRNRQLLQERLFQNHHTASTALSSILRNSGMRLTGRYGLHGGIHRSQWPGGWIPRPPTLANSNNIVSTKAKGKQLVDFETLSCLMVILFLDDSKINTGRLHRVIRNLCYHSQTRMWMVKSLLSVLEKSNESNLFLDTEDIHSSAVSGSSSSLYRPTPTRSGTSSDPDKKVITYVELVPSWLNISLDSAIGCSANVFQIYRATGHSAKKMGTEHRFISIHSQAVSQIARHTIDALSNLAKSFPTHFLPHVAVEQEVKILNTEPCSTPDSKKGSQSSCSCSPGKSKSADTGDLLFWDYLLKLDGATSGKKGKSLAKLGLHAAPPVDPAQITVTFEASPFGKLIKMLAYRFIRRSQMLTDKLLRLLSLISLGIPENSGYGKKVLLEEPQASADESSLISEAHLRLIVEVITSKSCSEEGLEEATALLLNLSYGPPTTRNMILALLTEGVRHLGNVVCSHIIGLIFELKTLHFDAEKEEEAHASSSIETDASEKVFKGMLTDRFTKETVVITSATKSKTTYELQLPSMSALTSKTSSQAFFLRLLKVIMNLRELIRGAITKHKFKGNVNSTPSHEIIQPSANESPQTQRRRENLNRYMARQLGLAVGGRSPRGSNSILTDDIFMEVVLPELPPLPSAAARLNPTQPGSGYTAPEAPVDVPVAGPSSSTQQDQPEDNSAEMNIKEEEIVFDENKLLPRLSSELQLEQLWSTLSECLLALGHTPDHHAVLVLQVGIPYLKYESTVSE